MNIKKISVGRLQANCYILEKDNKVLIIDPGDELDKIDELIDGEVIGVLITHNHFDHVSALKEAKSKIEFINSLFNDLTIIPVPKSCSKTMMTQTKGAILVDDFSGNLKEWQESGGIAVKFVKELENGKYTEITSLAELLDMNF